MCEVYRHKLSNNLGLHTLSSRTMETVLSLILSRAQVRPVCISFASGEPCGSKWQAIVMRALVMHAVSKTSTRLITFFTMTLVSFTCFRSHIRAQRLSREVPSCM